MTTMKSAWQAYSAPGIGKPPIRAFLSRRRWWLAGAALLIVAGAGTAAMVLRPGASAPAVAAPNSALTVTAVMVQAGSVPRTLMVTGSLAARDELPIGTETSDLAISEVLVDIGDHVKAGQLLVRFNDKVLRAQLQQAQAALHEAQANAAEADANARRADELVKNGWISGKDFDNRRASALTMEARVGVAQANLALADAKLKQSEVHAPSDGTISARTARLGAVLSAGGGELFRMIRDDRIELVAELPEADLAAVKTGQTVRLQIDGATNGLSAVGTVRLVEPTVDVKTRIGRVRIDVDKASGLLPGMFVTGRVALGQTDAPVVPEKAVIYLDGKPVLVTVDESSKASLHPVTLGARGDGTVAVMSGVVPGDTVVLRGAGYLKEGDHVTVAEVTAVPGGATSSRAQ